MGLRYFSGAYALPSGRFVADLAVKPSFGSIGAAGVLSPKTLLLVSMLSTAYIAHFNAPKFYRELKDATIQRFNTVTGTSFGISILFYTLLSSCAFLTFGASTAPMVLNNYATSDILISISRFAVALSLVCSYPLLFVGTRDGLLDLIQVPDSQRSNSLLNRVSVATVAIITLVATKVTDLTLVASLSGAILGTSLIFLYPTLMFRAATKTSFSGRWVKWERRLCSVIVSLGMTIGLVGTKMALQTVS